MLCERYDFATLRRALLPQEAWRPFPPSSDGAAWDALMAKPDNQQRRAFLIGAAESVRMTPWPVLPATLYMEFMRCGNRSRFEKAYFDRRNRLGALVLAQCMVDSDRWMDAIMDGLWLICEETSWCVPAHAQRRDHDPLVSPDRPSVDLFACETAMVLAEAIYLLREELTHASSGLVDRIEDQIRTRVIEPVEQRDDFRWLDGHNNWTPWCASNALGAAMYVLRNPDRLAKLTWKMMTAADHYITRYSDDGGCDEGPSYWNVGPGALFLLLEMLYDRTQGAITIFDEPKIHAMARYLPHVHLDGPWFANFADAPARLTPRGAILYRFGERVSDQAVRSFATLANHGWQAGDEAAVIYLDGYARGGTGKLLTDRLRQIAWLPDRNIAHPSPPAREVWFDQLQCLVARETTQAGRGLVLAAKGGHNAENHNHNDVGQFIIFLDGRPGIVDVGVGEYTRATFDHQRYTLWPIRGSGHNAPVVNGVEQAYGPSRRATNVQYKASDDRVQLSMRLDQAFPPEAGLVELTRQMTLMRGDEPSIEIEDRYELADTGGELTLTLYAADEPDLAEAGRVTFIGSCGDARRLVMTFDPARMTVTSQKQVLTDKKLMASWGDHLWKLTLVHRSETRCGRYKLRFCAADA